MLDKDQNLSRRNFLRIGNSEVTQPEPKTVQTNPVRSPLYREGNTSFLTRKISRRTVVKMFAGVVGYKILSTLNPEQRVNAQELPYSFLDTPPVETQESESNAEIQWTWGTQEYAPHPDGLINTSGQPMRGDFPDGATVSWMENTTRVVHFSAGRQEFESTIDTEGNLTTAIEVFRPDRQPSEYGTWEYAGVPTVFEVEGKKYGLAHLEHWASPEDGFPFTAQVALVEWNEETRQWSLIDVVINGLNPLFAGEEVSGAGQPTAFIEGEYLYCLFTEWDSNSDSIHAARVPVSQLTDPNAWRRWDGNDYTQSALDADSSQPVIAPESGGIYSALPNIITDRSTGNRYVIYEENNRFAIRKLIDIATMQFSSAQTLATFPDVEHKYNPGHPWYSYPSFIDPDSESPQEFVTGEEGLFVYSRGWRGSSDGHGMFMKPLTFA